MKIQDFIVRMNADFNGVPIISFFQRYEEISF